MVTDSSTVLSGFIRPPFSVMGWHDVEPFALKARAELLLRPGGKEAYDKLKQFYKDNPLGNEALIRPSLLPEQVGSRIYYRERQIVHEQEREEIAHGVLSVLGEEISGALNLSEEQPRYYIPNTNDVMRGFASLESGNAINPLRLSTPGMMWRNNNLNALEEVPELLIENDPALFVLLSYYHQDIFNDFTAETHLYAYKKSGAYNLSFGDAFTAFVNVMGHADLFGSIENWKHGLNVTKGMVRANLDEGFRNIIAEIVRTPQHSNDIRYPKFELRFIELVIAPILAEKQNADVSEADVEGYFRDVFTQALQTSLRRRPEAMPMLDRQTITSVGEEIIENLVHCSMEHVREERQARAMNSSVKLACDEVSNIVAVKQL